MKDGEDLNLVLADAIGNNVRRPGDGELPRSLDAAFAARERWRDEFEGRGNTPIFWEIQAGKPATNAYTLRRRRETFDAINELTMTLMQGWAVHTQRQADTARSLAVETWLQRNGVIAITPNKKVLPVLLE